MSPTEWGNATWMLFHTLAQQIREEDFSKYKDKIIGFIVNTCAQLPCPICATDASQKLSVAYLHLIRDKTDLIHFVHQFHNVVNNKLGKPVLSVADVGDRYKLARLDVVINNFLRSLTRSYGNMKMLIHSFQRQHYINQQRPLLNELKQHCRGGK